MSDVVECRIRERTVPWIPEEFIHIHDVPCAYSWTREREGPIIYSVRFLGGGVMHFLEHAKPKSVTRMPVTLRKMPHGF